MKLLEIQSSVRQEGSVSHTLASKFIFHWRFQNPDTQHRLRDVGQNPPAMITGDWVAANLTPPDQQTEKTISALFSITWAFKTFNMWKSPIKVVLLKSGSGQRRRRWLTS